MVSQSSSTPLHRSGSPVEPPWQTIWPFKHTVVPAVHGGLLMPQGSPTPKTLSSTAPLQSLSMLSQTSVEGSMPPMHSSTQLTHNVVPISHWLSGLVTAS
jgi:hypothetical protein